MAASKEHHISFGAVFGGRFCDATGVLVVFVSTSSVVLSNRRDCP